MGRIHKKLVAGVLAASLIIGGFFSAFPKELKASSGGNGGGTGALEGLAEDVFNVVIPTQPDIVESNVELRSVLDFLLDPHGLAQDGMLTGKKLEPGASVYFKNEETGALYDYSSTSDALKIVNKSTTNVDITLKAGINGMDGIRLTSDENFINDSNASVYFALTDSAGKKAAVDKYGAFLKKTLAGQPDAYKVVYNGKYKYEMKSNAEIAAEGITFPEYLFRLTGKCNSANGWTKLTEPLNPNVVLVWRVALRAKSVAPSIGKLSYVMNKGKDVNIDVDLGSGKLAAKGIKAITYTKTTGAAILSTENYSLVNGILSIKGAYISSVINAGVMSRSYTVTFDDAAQTQITILLTVDSMGPSVDGTIYSMVEGKPVVIGIDLGNGDLGATGIKSITYTKASGSATLSTDNYAFANGVLTLNASYISSVLKAGIASRDYVITFNDKAQTGITITLNVDGAAPSVLNSSYSMRRGEDVEIDVDLGAGELAATGIKSITYNTATGIRTLAIENYSFVDGVISIKNSYIDAVLDVGVKSRDYTVVFDNVTETKAVVTLVADDVAPSITTTAYTMHNGKAVTIAVGLGSGELGATGIKEITYTTASGLTTLASENYSFANGLLTLKASYISAVIGVGVESRDYTIRFNDRAQTTVKITLSADGMAPSVLTKTCTMRRKEDVEIDVDLGTSELAATGIRSITYNTASGLKTMAISNYSFENGVIIFHRSYIEEVLNAGIKTRDYTIVFDNMTGTKAVVTLVADDIAPTIVTTAYVMHNGKAVTIDTDLGSGYLGATGIKAITYTTSSGLTTLASGNYSLTNGKLTLNASYISAVLGAGVESRDYTIMFNDQAQTAVKITLNADGTAPSAQAATYPMRRGADVTVGVDLGTGELAATGIRSITYNTAAGSKTLSTSNYSFANGVLTIKKSYIEDVLNVGVRTRDYTIIFNNISGKKAVITLVADDVAPSIATTTYTMQNGKAVTVNTNLGSGVLGATGIKTITYTKASGLATLASGNYSFVNGTLTMNASYISDVLNAGVTSRNYTITFNDAAQTQVTVTLKK